MAVLLIKYKLYQFSSFNKEFEKRESVLRKNGMKEGQKDESREVISEALQWRSPFIKHSFIYKTVNELVRMPTFYSIKILHEALLPSTAAVQEAHKVYTTPSILPVVTRPIWQSCSEGLWTNEKIFVIASKASSQERWKLVSWKFKWNDELSNGNNEKLWFLQCLLKVKYSLFHKTIDDDDPRVSVDGYIRAKYNLLFRHYKTTQTVADSSRHCAKEAKQFLRRKSRTSYQKRHRDLFWPAHSADLIIFIPFLGCSKKVVYTKQRPSIQNMT